MKKKLKKNCIYKWRRKKWDKSRAKLYEKKKKLKKNCMLYCTNKKEKKMMKKYS